VSQSIWSGNSASLPRRTTTFPRNSTVVGSGGSGGPTAGVDGLRGSSTTSGPWHWTSSGTGSPFASWPAPGFAPPTTSGSTFPPPTSMNVARTFLRSVIFWAPSIPGPPLEPRSGALVESWISRPVPVTRRPRSTRTMSESLRIT